MIEPWNLAMAISACISCIASASIIITCILFKDLRKLRFIELVLYISINDFIASLGAGFGHPNNNAICWFQGIVTNYNYLVGACWTCIICYQIYIIVIYNRIIHDLSYYHVICWLCPAIITVLPFTTYNTYGRSDDDKVEWCFIAPTSKSPSYGTTLWEILAFYLWLWISIVTMVVFIGYISIKIRHQRHPSDVLLSTVQKLYWYPIIFIACWIIPTVSDFSDIYADDRHNWEFSINIVSSIIPIYQGFFLALVFFSKNQLVREHWYLLLHHIYHHHISSCFKSSSSSSSSSTTSSMSSSKSSSKNMMLPSHHDHHRDDNNDDHMMMVRSSELANRLTLESDYVVARYDDNISQPSSSSSSSSFSLTTTPFSSSSASYTSSLEMIPSSSSASSSSSSSVASSAASSFNQASSLGSNTVSPLHQISPSPPSSSSSSSSSADDTRGSIDMVERMQASFYLSKYSNSPKQGTSLLSSSPLSYSQRKKIPPMMSNDASSSASSSASSKEDHDIDDDGGKIQVTYDDTYDDNNV